MLNKKEKYGLVKGAFKGAVGGPGCRPGNMIFAFLVAAIFMLMLLPGGGLPDSAAEAAENRVTGYSYHRNLSDSSQKILLYPPIFPLSSEQEVYSLSELETAVRERLLEWDGDFSIRYIGDTGSLTEEIEQIIGHILDNHDYLKYNISQWGFSYGGYVVMLLSHSRLISEPPENRRTL